MRTLRSFVAGSWHTASSGLRPLVDPSTEEVIAQASSDGVDFAAVLESARRAGDELRRSTFAERGAVLKAVGKALRAERDELLELSRRNNGAVTPDGAFDIDGASGTMSYYAAVARQLGDRHTLVDGDGAQLWRDESFWSQHQWAPRHGVAVAINAFNFPAWGFAEKAACALLAGVPVVTKPATATALVAERTFEIVLEAATAAGLPDGALQLICGGTGDLLDRLGPQDVFAFTGSAATAARLRDRDNLRAHNTRINIEADSLNAAVLAPDVAPGAVSWDLFVKDVVREMRQKTGQKCTAVRRILVPTQRLDDAADALAAALDEIVVGRPGAESVTMGPLATADQLADTVEGTAALREVAELVHGSGERVDGVGVDAGTGFFFGPTLLRAANARAAAVVHEREVFAPVATLLPYGGEAVEAAEIVALGGGTLVTSVYGDDTDWLTGFVGAVGHATGRVYVGSESAAKAAPGSGIAMPQSLHGGPGRAGGGEELGGVRGVQRYMQRTAVQGHRSLVDTVTGAGVAEGD
ncbi:MAG: 3,4-dehydroadipyl-CoA semialdehyde dehydrogenase [Acidobacteriota bacterium]